MYALIVKGFVNFVQKEKTAKKCSLYWKKFCCVCNF